MGLFDIFGDMAGDVFGTGAGSGAESSGSALEDFFFGGFGGRSAAGGSPATPPFSVSDRFGLGAYRDPILPTGSQARGYGGEYFGTKAAADKSCLIDGNVCDPETGYTGTPAQIYDRYLAEGRDPAPLLKRYRRPGLF